MNSIENEQLRIEVNARGAELNSIYSKNTKLEYLWSGDPEFWSKKSPVLFPIVGGLKNNTYYYNNSSYKLSRHGFARDLDFILSDETINSLTFTLNSNTETLKNYPFHFRLDIIYSISANKLNVKYIVSNTGKENMYFSIGAHPAFKIPIEDKRQYEDYYIEFSECENARRWLISHDGLIEAMPVPFMNDSKKLQLTKELFSKDAIVFKHINSSVLNLKTDKSKHGIEFEFPRFSYLGIWAAKNADFICIEPWCGIADSINSNQQLVNKEGINILPPDQSFKRNWAVTVY